MRRYETAAQIPDHNVTRLVANSYYIAVSICIIHNKQYVNFNKQKLVACQFRYNINFDIIEKLATLLLNKLDAWKKLMQ